MRYRTYGCSGNRWCAAVGQGIGNRDGGRVVSAFSSTDRALTFDGRKGDHFSC